MAVNDGDGTGKISTDDRKGRKILANMTMEGTPNCTHAIPTGTFLKKLDTTLTVMMMTHFSRERRTVFLDDFIGASIAPCDADLVLISPANFHSSAGVSQLKAVQ